MEAHTLELGGEGLPQKVVICRPHLGAGTLEKADVVSHTLVQVDVDAILCSISQSQVSQCSQRSSHNLSPVSLYTLTYSHYELITWPFWRETDNLTILSNDQWSVSLGVGRLFGSSDCRSHALALVICSRPNSQFIHRIVQQKAQNHDICLRRLNCPGSYRLKQKCWGSPFRESDLSTICKPHTGWLCVVCRLWVADQRSPSWNHPWYPPRIKTDPQLTV